MDWTRLQGHISSIDEIRVPRMDEFRTSGAAEMLNTVVFHTTLVDDIESLLTETSDLSMFYFYQDILRNSFAMCLQTDQVRFSISFPLVCTHFEHIPNQEYCPEETGPTREKGLTMINSFLDELSKETKHVVSKICEEQAVLANKLLPTSSIAQVMH